MTILYKGYIGKEDHRYNADELLPTTTFARLGSVGNVNITYFPDIYKTHLAIINARYWNSGALTDTTISKAATYIGANNRILYIEPGAWSILSDLTLPSNITVMFDKGAQLTIASGKTLTIQGEVIAGAYRVFYGTGTATLSKYPQERAWWGDTQRTDFTGVKTTNLTMVEGANTYLMSAFIKTLMNDANAAAARTTLGTVGAQLRAAYAAATGTDTYTAAMPTTLIAYTTGDHYFIKIQNANTSTTPTLELDGLGAKTIVKDGTNVLIPGDMPDNHAAIFKYDGTYMVLLNPGGVASALALRSYLAGLTLSNDTDTEHDIAIAVGTCRDSSNVYAMTLSAILTKQIEATWSAGNDAGGMNDTDHAVSNATWYHVHLLYNPSNGSVDAGFDTSITATNLLADTAVVAAGFTKYRRLGSVLTNGSANILNFVQVGNEFLWKDPPQDVSAISPGTNAVTRTLSVPLGVKVLVHTNAGASPDTDTACQVYLSSLEVDDEAAAGMGTAPGLTIGAEEVGGDVPRAMGQASILTNTSSQIRSRVGYTTAGFQLYIYTLGWTDYRGRDD